jgi:X-linked retinitis pigmentosa GTPase regulator
MAFLTPKGLYTMGSNAHGKLGLGVQSPSVNSPTMVKHIRMYSWEQVSCGWDHTACILNGGDFYVWGSWKYGAVGSNEKDADSNIFSYTPVKFRFRLGREKVRMTRVVCGKKCTWVIDEKERLFVWGKNESGELGVGDFERRDAPEVVMGRVAQVAVGEDHLLVLGKKGDVFAAGRNLEGQLGIPGIKFLPKFKKVEGIKEWVKVKAGGHSAAIDRYGQLYVWGSSSIGDFEQPVNVSEILPHLKNDLGIIQSVDISSNFTLVLNDQGQLYSWGSNNYGQLGLGNYETQYSPKLISKLNEETKISKVACGQNFVVALGRTIYDKNNQSNISEDKENRPINISTRINKKHEEISFGSFKDISNLWSKPNTSKHKNNKNLIKIRTQSNLSPTQPNFSPKRSKTPWILSNPQMLSSKSHPKFSKSSS